MAGVCVASATLVVWAAAWLHGHAAPDDVLDALQVWGERQDVGAADVAAAEATGLPLPPAQRAAPLAELLPMLRRLGAPLSPALVLPAPGDVRGLDGGGPFTTAALRSGEAALLLMHDVGLVPSRFDDGALRWTAYRLSGTPSVDHTGIADAEQTLTDAVRDSAGALAALQVARERPDAHDALRERLRARPRLSWPPGTPGRSLRVLQRADEVDAILALADADDPGGALSATAAAQRAAALRPPAAAVRTARTAAIAEAARAFTADVDRRTF